MAVKSVVKRGVAVAPVRARVARARGAKSAVSAAAAAAPVAVAGRGRCPVCGSVEGEALAVPREMSAKERAASAAHLRELRKKYPPRVKKHRGKSKGSADAPFAEFRKVAAKWGVDDLFPLPGRE